MMADVNMKRKSDGNLQGEPPAKVTRSIRGVSRQQLPTVVMAMGFAIGTSSDDIRQSFTATGNNDAEGLPPNIIKATYCQVISVGSKVIAKLTFPNNTAAKEVVANWNRVEVDGGELLVWTTDDVESPLKSEPQSPGKSFKSYVPTKGVNGNTSPLANGNLFGGFGSTYASAAAQPATPSTPSLFTNTSGNLDCKTAQTPSLFSGPLANSNLVPDPKTSQKPSLFSGLFAANGAANTPQGGVGSSSSSA